ncbi:MAG TPA: sulfatase [Acidobacteriota bacterium]|nr:sulfatase [Acidobacteriota bacterium]
MNKARADQQSIATGYPTLICCAFFLAVAMNSCSPDVEPAAQQQPNILFVFTDDHAAQAISAYGSTINKTPNIDRLAQEGMLFRNCLVTNSICAPSRAVVLTGKHSHINGVIDNRVEFDGSQTTFPKLLQQAGYETAMIGKWHLKSEPEGFDYWEVLPGQGRYYNPEFRTPEGTVQYTGYTTHIITDRALEWLKEKRNNDKPFLLHYWHKAPHRNWQPGPDYLTLFDDQDIPEPETLFDDYSNRGSAAKTQEMTVAEHLNEGDLKFTAPRNLTPEQLSVWNAAYDPKNQQFEEAALAGDDLVRWKYQRYIKDYLRCVQAVDDDLGKVLDYLDESGLADNTVVIYSSDQGFYLGEHGWFDKRFIYEESLRMPLLVRWPGRVQPRSVDTHLVQNLDFAPTVLEMAGVEVPTDLQGKSLMPLLSGEAVPDWRSAAYYHYYEYPGAHSVRRHYGIRTDRYKLAYFYVLDEWEFFDLEKDPNELVSRYEDSEYSSQIEKLTGELARLRERYEVPDVDPPSKRPEN